MRKRRVTRLYPPLIVCTQRRVRFEEVDQLACLWHGHYASWLEDGREAFGARYAVGYLDFYNNGTAVPLKSLTLEYHHPLRYNVTYTIETSLLWNEAAVVEFAYRILDDAGQCMTTAHTLQMMIDLQGTLMLDSPAFYKRFLQQWSEGALA